MSLADLEGRLVEEKQKLELHKLTFKRQKEALVKTEDDMVMQREVIRLVEETIETYKLNNIDISIDDVRDNDIESFRDRYPGVLARLEANGGAEIRDPLRDWARANRVMLEGHKGNHIAVSMREGILISTPDKAEFALKIARMNPDQRVGLYFVHTSELKV